MTPTLTRSGLVAELKRILNNDRHKLASQCWEAAIDAALLDLSQTTMRPLIHVGSLTLVPNQRFYVLDDCVEAYVSSDWGMHLDVPLWEISYVVPSKPRLIKDVQGSRLLFSPTPTWAMINLYGSTFEYLYGARHLLTDEDCSILPNDYELLKVAALITLMRELIASHVVTPITLQTSLTMIPPSVTPAGALAALLDEYERLRHAG